MTSSRLEILGPAPNAMVNAKTFGAVGDGVTDDTVALRTALATGKSVSLSWGTYLTGKLTLGSNQWLVGVGCGATVLKLKSATNDNLIETTNFATLKGGNSTGGATNFGICMLTLDGNNAGQSSDSSYALAIYGYSYHLSQIIVRDGGIYSEWSTDTLSSGAFEATISDFKIHDYSGTGLYFKGPHDSIITHGQIIRCGTLGSGTSKVPLYFPSGGASNGVTVDSIHVWGATYDYGCVLSGSGLTFGTTCQFEGADISQILINASRQRIAGKYFAGGDSYMTASAFKFAAGTNNIDFDAKIEDLIEGVDVSAGGVTGLFGRIRAQYAAGTAPSSIIIGGILDQHSGLEVLSLNSSGVSTGSDFRFPGSLQASNVKSYSLTGNETSSRIDVIPRDLCKDGRGLSNGLMQLSFFTPDFDFIVSNLIVESRGGGTGATLVRMALFRVPTSDLLTCIARTSNDTTILGSSNALHTRTISDNGAASPSVISNVVIQRGLRYAFAVLGVGWTGTPQVGGTSTSFNMANLFPMLSATISGQTDIGSSYTSGIDADSTRMWGGLT